MPSLCAVSITRDLLKIRICLRRKGMNDLQEIPVDMKLEMKCWLETMMASVRSVG